MGIFTIEVLVPAFIIAGVGINYIIKAMKLKKEYTKYIDDISNAEEENTTFAGQVFKKKNLRNEGLASVLNNFIKSAKGKTVDINTEVIIESNLRKGLSEDERKLENGGAVCIALGLLGTFVGLTIAIIKANGAMEASKQSMDNFVTAMGEPMNGMAVAFLTTIAGVICSLIINKLAGQVRLEKENFYSLFEDYLDNYIFSKYYVENEQQYQLIETFKEGLTLMTSTFEKNMDRVVDKIENVFSVKMENIIEKIELNNEETRKNVRAIGDFTDDIRRLVKKFDETVSGISVTTENLNETIQGLEVPISSFGNQIDKLEKVNKTFVTELDKSMGGFNGNLDKTMKKFNTGIDHGISTFNSGIENSVLQFNSAISKAKDSMNEENERFTKVLNTSIENLNSIVEKSVISSKYLSESIDKNNKINEELSDALNKEFDMLNNTNKSLIETLEKMSTISDENSEIIKNEIERLNDTYRGLNDFIKDFEGIIENIQLKSGVIARETINEGIENLSDKTTQKLEPSINDLEDLTKNSLEATNDLLKMTKVLTDAVTDMSEIISSISRDE